jgi:hypothetical protein
MRLKQGRNKKEASILHFIEDGDVYTLQIVIACITVFPGGQEKTKK